MTKEEYREARRKLGTQVQVARLLAVDHTLISKRERGVVRVNREAELAIKYLLENVL